jgi:hypothetical protein
MHGKTAQSGDNLLQQTVLETPLERQARVAAPDRVRLTSNRTRDRRHRRSQNTHHDSQ